MQSDQLSISIGCNCFRGCWHSHAAVNAKLFKSYSDSCISSFVNSVLLSFDTRGKDYTSVRGLCYVEWSRRVLSSHHVLRPLWRRTEVASNSWFISNCWRCGIGQHL